jgi:hypothetical protein
MATTIERLMPPSRFLDLSGLGGDSGFLSARDLTFDDFFAMLSFN